MYSIIRGSLRIEQLTDEAHRASDIFCPLLHFFLMMEPKFKFMVGWSKFSSLLFLKYKVYSDFNWFFFKFWILFQAGILKPFKIWSRYELELWWQYSSFTWHWAHPVQHHLSRKATASYEGGFWQHCLWNRIPGSLGIWWNPRIISHLGIPTHPLSSRHSVFLTKCLKWVTMLSTLLTPKQYPEIHLCIQR